MSTFTYILVIKELTLIWALLTLGLFCIKRSICREFSTDVEVPYRYVNIGPYRHVSNCIRDTYEWLNGSLVKLDNIDNMDK